MRLRCPRGFSLVELLASIALLGLLATTSLGLFTILAHAVSEEEMRGEALASSVHAVRSFRSDASQADQAYVWNDQVTLVGDGPEIRWAVRGGRLQRIATKEAAEGDPGSMRLDVRPNGALVIVELPPYGLIVARVGGNP